MKKSLGLLSLISFCTIAATAAVQVSISQPTAGAVVSSPLQVVAKASSTQAITGWYVYSDNQAVYHQTGASLNASVTLATGTHTLTIRAWDSSGAFGSQNVSVTVSQSTQQVFRHIEDMSNWGGCGSRACAGGAGDASVFWMAPFQTTPSVDGSSAEFYISGPEYANALHWKKFAAQNAATNYLWDFWVLGDSASLTAQAMEFDLFTVVPINGQNRKFMFGTQCDFAAGVWDGWNEPTQHWVHTSIPCGRFPANTWHHIVWYLRRMGTNNGSLQYVSLTVDGVVHQLNLIEPSTATTWTPGLGIQFQQDEGKSATPFHEWVDTVTLTFW